jgi:uncharacterized iron-regulated protein
MAKRWISNFWVWSVGIVLLCTLPLAAQQMISPLAQQQHSRQAVLVQLAQAEVVYLGETHDSAKDHEAQLEIIRSLYRLRPKIAIALEMFQRPYQGVLDRYLRGALTEAELREQSQYNQRWSYPWQFYAPLLRFAKEHRLPLVALNTPTEVTRKVAGQGLESLTPAEQQYIPAIAEIDTSNSVYRQQIFETYQAFHQDQGSSVAFDHFFQAQVLWDETMADAIAQFLQAHPGYQVIVLAGKGHIAYGYGIPSRVARRMAKVSDQLGTKFVQYSVLLNPDEETDKFNETPAADYFWHHLDFNQQHK